MKKSQIGTIQRTLLLLILLISFGCAQQMKTVKPDTETTTAANAEIIGITVSDKGSRVEILSDKPIVYTYYTLESPPRVIIDLANTSPAKITYPMEVNKGSLKRIDVSKHEFGSGVLSRVEMSLASKVDVSSQLDQEDKRKLVINLPLAAPPQQETSVTEPAPAPAIQPGEPVKVVEPVLATIEKESTVQDATITEPPKIESAPATPAIPLVLTTKSNHAIKPGERTLTAIKKIADGIMLEFSAEPENFKTFKLTSPERFVIDIPKTKSAVELKPVEINAYNLGKGRIGVSPERLRIVLDAQGGKIPVYTISKSGSSLVVMFGEAAQSQKAAAGKNEPKVEPAKVEPAMTDTVKAEPVKAEPVKAEPVVQSEKSGTDASRPADSPAPPAAPVLAAGSPPIPAKAVGKKGMAGVVESIEFTQSEGISRITVRTSGDCRVVDPVKTSRGLLLSLKGCRLPLNLQRPLNTRAFESVISNITPSAQKKGASTEAKIAVVLKSAAPNSIKRDKDLLQWEFREPPAKAKPLMAAKAPKAAPVATATPSGIESEISGDKQLPRVKGDTDKAMEEAFVLEKASQPVTRQGKAYTGRKVTLEFSDADIRKIFQLLAEVSNQNFLVSDDVSGTISLKLVNVPWDQALDVILENKGLGMQRDGNIVQIRPKTKMKSLDDEAIEMRFTEEKKMPLSTVVFDINYAALGDIENQFRAIKSKRSDSSITSDARTNKIIVADIDPNIRKMRNILESLDIPEKQVMIEARIVEASSTFAKDIGVKWNFGFQDGSASIANINNITGSMGGVVSNVLPSASTGGLATGLSFGKLLSNVQLDMRLSAASTIGQIKIISTPKVLTVNNKAAKISQGQSIPYQNTSSTEGAKTEFVEAALSLEVTPHITADGSVNMKIKASNNSPGSGSPPPINKKEATTELVVKNGETTVIGGIYVDSETEGDTGIPYISSIPLLGWLFKSNALTKSKNELLIFITPRIIN